MNNANKISFIILIMTTTLTWGMARFSEDIHRRSIKACTKFELRFPLQSRDYVWRLNSQQPESDIVLQNEEYRTTNGGETAFIFMPLRPSETTLNFVRKPLTENYILETITYLITVTKNPQCPVAR